MIKYSRNKKIHFIGIGGAGMSGIAEVLYNMGFDISGSDMAGSAVTERLKKRGVTIYIGHDKSNVQENETVVFSSAIRQSNVEIKEALKRKIPVISRAEMLAELMRMKFSIAVAGTHGKTTTTAMIASILGVAGKDPTYVVGGKLKTEESGAKLGKSDYLVAEADESDGSFLQLYPTVGVITNIEDDHLDYYGSMENLLNAFVQFANKVPFYGSVLLNADCENSTGIISRVNKRKKTFGFSKKADIRATGIKEGMTESRFTCWNFEENLGEFHLGVGGKHNILNALAAVTVALDIGIPANVINEGLKRYSLPERRFQILFSNERNTVIDDYAHHPTEIQVTLDTIKKGNFKRIIVVFQPHRFTRLEILMDKFAAAFSGADWLILTQLYSANQDIIENVNSRTLADRIIKRGFKNITYIEKFGDIISRLKNELQDGDAVLFCSAGNLTVTAHQFAREMEEMER